MTQAKGATTGQNPHRWLSKRNKENDKPQPARVSSMTGNWRLHSAVRTASTGVSRERWSRRLDR
jgi:hypothetical protein